MREPFPGAPIAGEALEWVLAEKGPQHAPSCQKCGQTFYSPLLKAPACHGCWYAGELEQAAVQFRPLSDELERILEVRTSVDQTGGMVMCLRVPIGREDEELGYTRRWAYFGEFPSECLGVGLYEVDGEGEYVYRDDGSGLTNETFHEYPHEFACGGEDQRCAWYHHPDLCKAVAEWAAPIIVEFATKEETP